MPCPSDNRGRLTAILSATCSTPRLQRLGIVFALLVIGTVLARDDAQFPDRRQPDQCGPPDLDQRHSGRRCHVRVAHRRRRPVAGIGRCVDRGRSRPVRPSGRLSGGGSRVDGNPGRSGLRIGQRHDHRMGQVAPFIVTLGMMTIARGLALLLSGGRPVSNMCPAMTRHGGRRGSAFRSRC